MIRLAYNILLFVIYIRGLIYKFDRHKHLLHTLHNAKKDLHWFYQACGATITLYLGTFKNEVLIIKACGGSSGIDTYLVQIKLADIAADKTHTTNEETEQAMNMVR